MTLTLTSWGMSLTCQLNANCCAEETCSSILDICRLGSGGPFAWCMCILERMGSRTKSRNDVWKMETWSFMEEGTSITEQKGDRSPLILCSWVTSWEAKPFMDKDVWRKTTVVSPSRLASISSSSRFWNVSSMIKVWLSPSEAVMRTRGAS